MSKRIKVADSPEFDAARYLDSETSIAAYLTDILQADDAAIFRSWSWAGGRAGMRRPGGRRSPA